MSPHPQSVPVDHPDRTSPPPILRNGEDGKPPAKKRRWLPPPPPTLPPKPPLGAPYKAKMLPLNGKVLRYNQYISTKRKIDCDYHGHGQPPPRAPPSMPSALSSVPGNLVPSYTPGPPPPLYTSRPPAPVYVSGPPPATLLMLLLQLSSRTPAPLSTCASPEQPLINERGTNVVIVH
ncbi:hypothetical protein BCR34DRAFT_598936 [Clohesyomyces aquaticus]|uniref:Uncharacterized protein n=1 Tax=Clohesyomyces aquaticus TaxID=1231657 RepID=A0A1Y1ZX36_9PLEO|nr:hypothetical protein BCR34DRAFT_598936 [Clohesyomyces aquaticus]